MEQQTVAALEPCTTEEDALIDTVAEIIEDAEGRRAVSISDVSSDPLEYRNRLGDYRSSRSGSVASGSDDDGGVGEDENDDDECDEGAQRGESVASAGVSSTDGVGSCKARAAPLAVEPADLAEVDTAADAAVGKIDAANLSPTPVATVESVILRSGTVVVNNAIGSSAVLDAGTRLCLADGRVVGTITTLLGPVKECAYAVCCDGAVLAALHMEELLAEGTSLFADTSKQHVLYDPIALVGASKPTDASFVNDEERPPHVRPDFSDDEEEKQWKRMKKEGLLPGGSRPSMADGAPGEGGQLPDCGDDEDLSSIESEVEVDESGEVLAYRPKEHLRKAVPKTGAAGETGRGDMYRGGRGGRVVGFARGGRGRGGAEFRYPAPATAAPLLNQGDNMLHHGDQLCSGSAAPPLKVLRTETRSSPHAAELPVQVMPIAVQVGNFQQNPQYGQQEQLQHFHHPQQQPQVYQVQQQHSQYLYPVQHHQQQQDYWIQQPQQLRQEYPMQQQQYQIHHQHQSMQPGSFAYRAHAPAFHSTTSSQPPPLPQQQPPVHQSGHYAQPPAPPQAPVVAKPPWLR